MPRSDSTRTSARTKLREFHSGPGGCQVFAQATALENFGLAKSERTNNAIYYRTTDPVHHVHITEKGDPKFVGIGYHAASEPGY